MNVNTTTAKANTAMMAGRRPDQPERVVGGDVEPEGTVLARRQAKRRRERDVAGGHDAGDEQPEPDGQDAEGGKAQLEAERPRAGVRELLAQLHRIDDARDHEG